MGILGIPTRVNKGKKAGSGDTAYYKNRNYSNKDAVEKVLRYITRTREGEDREENLINYGAAGADYFHSVDNMIQQFCYVQHVYGINSRGGRRMYHEVLNLKDCELERLGRDPKMLWQVGMECCQVYFQMGHQAVFAVHWEPEKRCHIHFAVNTINFQNGRKWHTALPEIKQREGIFNEILCKYQIMATGAIEVLEFLNDEGNALDGQKDVPYGYYIAT